jgi:hypothetical protein
MNNTRLHEHAQRISKPYRVTNGKKFRLKNFNPADTGAELQDMLYAQDRWSVLLIFQAMDAAGKDGAIKHVMSGVNPQGCQVYSFKAPSSEELDHDWMWRCVRASARARAHRHLQPQLLRGGAGREGAPGDPRRAEAAPRALGPSGIWDERYQDIRRSSATSRATAR